MALNLLASTNLEALIAAALLGKDAVIQGGDAMAIIGVGLHFLITIGAAAIYYLVAKRQGWLVRHAFLSGLLFGTLFFLAMNYVILPLSVIGHPLYIGGETIGVDASSRLCGSDHSQRKADRPTYIRWHSPRWMCNPHERSHFLDR